MASVPPVRARPWFPGGERVASFLLLIATLYAAYLTVRPVLLVVTLAAAVASLSFGLFRRAERLVGGRRRIGAALTVFVVILGIFGPLAIIGFFAAQRLVLEATELAERALHDKSSVATLSRHLGPLAPYAERTLQNLAPSISSAAPELAHRAAQVLGALGSAVLQIAVGIFLLAVALYYFYLNGPAWSERFVRIVPLSPNHARTFLARFHQVSVGVLVGNLGTALVQGTLGTVGYLLLGVPVPLMWGLATAAASLLPPLGSALVWVPLAILMALTHGLLRGVLLVLYGGGVVGTIDNVVRPLLTKNRLKIHPLFVFIALFGGIASYGLAGLFLGPLVVALAVTVLDLYEQSAAGEEPPSRF